MSAPTLVWIRDRDWGFLENGEMNNRTISDIGSELSGGVGSKRGRRRQIGRERV